MSNYNNLKTTIDANIKQNGNQEITGQILNSVLNQMVNILGTGYQFAGVATLDPATDPGTPDAKVFYIANGKGTYTNFGSLEVTEDEVVVLYWDSAWHKVATGIASQAKLSELESEVTEYPTGKNLYNPQKDIVGYVFNYGSVDQGKTLVIVKDSACSYYKMDAKPNVSYALSASSWAYGGFAVLVDENMVILNASPKKSNNRIIEGHANAKYLLIHTMYNNAVMEDLQIEEGNIITPYEPFKAGINPQLLPPYTSPEEFNALAEVVNDMNWECTNVLGNSHFDAIGNWYTYQGALSVSEGKAIFEVTSPTGSSRINYRGGIPNYQQGHKYYAFANIKTPKDCIARLYIGSAYGLPTTQLRSNILGRASAIVEPTSNSELGFYFDTSAMNVGDVVEIYSVGLIDITNIKEWKNETALGIDNFLKQQFSEGWFEGTINLLPSYIGNLNYINKVQEKYIVASKTSAKKDVADFVCDGYNDQEEINAAINSLPAEGGTIELLEGTYLLNLPIYPKQNTRIVGQGEGTILLVADKVEASVIGGAFAGYNNLACNTEGFQIGMDVTIFDDDHFGYNQGESKQIVAITHGTNGTLTFNSPFKNNYTKNARVFSAYNAIDCHNVSHVTIENLQIDGNMANQSVGNYDEWQNGVYLVDSHQSVVQNCYIHDCAMIGICSSHIADAGGSENCILSDNHIYDCGMNAIHVHGMKNSLISNNIVRGGSRQSSIYLILSDSMTLIGNNIDSNEAVGLMILASKNVSVVGGYIKDTNGAGILITSASGVDCSNISIGSVILNNIGENGIKINNLKGGAVSSCVIENVVSNGIAVALCERLTIIGNSVANPSSHGIIEYVGNMNVLNGNIVIKTAWGPAIESSSPRCVVTNNIVNSTYNDGVVVSGEGSVEGNNIEIKS